MPQVKKVKPLFKLCLQFITSNMKYWSQLEKNNLVGNSGPMLAPWFNGPTAGAIEQKERVNPFEQLSPFVLDEIVAKLKRNGIKQTTYKRYGYGQNCSNHDDITHNFVKFDRECDLHAVLKITVLERLIIQQLTRLDLSRQSDAEVYRLLEVASARCKNLKSLKLEFTFNFNCFNFFPNFGNLLSLDISNSKAGDIWLKSIGTYCIHLRELFVQNCRNVTDCGIKWLFMTSMDKPHEKNFCKSIQILSLLTTSVTKEGIQMALQHCPALTALIHRTLLNVLTEIAQLTLDRDLQNIPIYSLSLLTDFIYKPLFEIHTLKLALNNLCPSVTKVKIEFTEFSDDELLCFVSLKKLHELKISNKLRSPNWYRPKITFHGGVGPLLIEIGNSLEILNLSFIGGVNISLITKFCFNLRSLTLNENFNYDTTLNESCSMNEKTILKKLVHLHLCCAMSTVRSTIFSDPIPSKDLVLLLSSPLISSLSITGCDTLTDNVIVNSSKLHQFRNLHYLSIEYSDLVTFKGLCVFLEHTGPLKKISLKSKYIEEKINLVEEFTKLVKIQYFHKNLALIVLASFGNMKRNRNAIPKFRDELRWSFDRKDFRGNMFFDVV